MGKVEEPWLLWLTLFCFIRRIHRAEQKWSRKAQAMPGEKTARVFDESTGGQRMVAQEGRGSPLD